MSEQKRLFEAPKRQERRRGKTGKPTEFREQVKAVLAAYTPSEGKARIGAWKAKGNDMDPAKIVQPGAA
jgi:hypothetical protein